MALELSSLPEDLKASSPHDIRRVVDDRGFQDFIEVNRQTWPDDNHGKDWIDALRYTIKNEPERTSAYVAYIDSIPVCTARIDFPESSPFASLWGGATIKAYRKRGLYTAILAIRAQEAIVRGYRFLTIDRKSVV